MLIGEIARKTGFTKDTIRFYERLGLVSPARSGRGKNAYRRYGASEIEKLGQIAGLKEFGFTLREIKMLFALGESPSPICTSVGSLVDETISSIDHKIGTLLHMKTRLEAARLACNGDCAEVLKAYATDRSPI